ncbi:hypothetical protein UlMin_038704 [Ulmus minor]
MDAPSSSSQPPEPLRSITCISTEEINPAENSDTDATAGEISDDSNTKVQNPPPCSEPIEENPAKPSKRNKKKAKKRALSDNSSAPSSPSSSPPLISNQRGTRVAPKRRSPRIVLGSARQNPVADAISFRLGMSIAAFVVQILERKDAPGQRISDDYLAEICASAIRESLANDFGNTFDSFVRNFEKSFRSTFKTLKLIKESSMRKGKYHISHLNIGPSSDAARDVGDLGCKRDCASSSNIEGRHSEELSCTHTVVDQLNCSPATEQNEATDCINMDLALHGQANQLTCVSSTPFGSTNQSMLSTVERSIIEQTRSNDLKTVELSLAMKKIRLKETELSLNFEANQLVRSKLDMGKSKASFKVEKFKTELEDVRHAELLRKCIDCLVAGLIIMVASLSYSAYVYSYKRITEATASCSPSSKASTSWWMPNAVASFNSGLQIVSCQVQALSRMLFGVLMILVIAYLLLQRSSASKQTMPVTFILLLLGFICGLAGKLCVDTLGGSGFHWLVYWEAMCLVHFFCNICTSTLFMMLHGPVTPSQGIKRNEKLPYWIRRFAFYGLLLVFLPIFCGLLPFASLGEWKDHFISQAVDYGSGGDDWNSEL